MCHEGEPHVSQHSCRGCTTHHASRITRHTTISHHACSNQESGRISVKVPLRDELLKLMAPGDSSAPAFTLSHADIMCNPLPVLLRIYRHHLVQICIICVSGCNPRARVRARAQTHSSTDTTTLARAQTHTHTRTYTHMHKRAHCHT